VLELSAEQVEVIGTPRPWKDERPVSREEQARNLGKFMWELATGLSGERQEGAQPRQETEADHPAERKNPVREHER
jgi:hypothetical protein